ncbi:MAG: hydrogenase expression/formation C-terminal domain-containing protein, partial [Candidatus Kryptonium sp.]
MRTDLINAVFLLNEIRHALVELKNEGRKRVINLSNFPLSNDEARFIDEALGRGNVKIIYEGVELTIWQETKISGVWWGE